MILTMLIGKTLYRGVYLIFFEKKSRYFKKNCSPLKLSLCLYPYYRLILSPLNASFYCCQFRS